MVIGLIEEEAPEQYYEKRPRKILKASLDMPTFEHLMSL